MVVVADGMSELMHVPHAEELHAHRNSNRYSTYHMLGAWSGATRWEYFSLHIMLAARCDDESRVQREPTPHTHR